MRLYRPAASMLCTGGQQSRQEQEAASRQLRALSATAEHLRARILRASKT